MVRFAIQIETKRIIETTVGFLIEKMDCNYGPDFLLNSSKKIIDKNGGISHIKKIATMVGFP